MSHSFSLKTMSVCAGGAVSVDGISSVGVTATGGFNEQKLILPPSVVAQSLSVCLAQSASASVLASMLILPAPMVAGRQIDQSVVELPSSLDRQSMAKRFVADSWAEEESNSQSMSSIATLSAFHK